MYNINTMVFLVFDFLLCVIVGFLFGRFIIRKEIIKNRKREVKKYIFFLNVEQPDHTYKMCETDCRLITSGLDVECAIRQYQSLACIANGLVDKSELSPLNISYNTNDQVIITIDQIELEQWKNLKVSEIMKLPDAIILIEYVILCSKMEKERWRIKTK